MANAAHNKRTIANKQLCLDCGNYTTINWLSMNVGALQMKELLLSRRPAPATKMRKKTTSKTFIDSCNVPTV